MKRGVAMVYVLPLFLHSMESPAFSPKKKNILRMKDGIKKLRHGFVPCYELI